MWERSTGRGTLVSWSSFFRDYYEGLLPVPYDTILVELEGKVLFVSNPSGFGEADCRPGMPVELCFLDCADSAGSFRLPVFRRASPNDGP